MLMLKYLLELVYLYNNEKDDLANEELKEGIQFVHTYLLQEDCFYAPQRQSLSDDTSANIIYEDGKFAYSNHATDPVSGILCNAFDLVRIHKFGDLDEDPESVKLKLQNKTEIW